MDNNKTYLELVREELYETQQELRTWRLAFVILIVVMLVGALTLNIGYWWKQGPVDRTVRNLRTEHGAESIADVMFKDQNIVGTYPTKINIGQYETYSYRFSIIQSGDPDFEILVSERDYADAYVLMSALSDFKDNYYNSFTNKAEQYYIKVDVAYNPKERDYSLMTQMHDWWNDLVFAWEHRNENI